MLLINLIERKSRMPQIQGSKGEAVVVYRESLLTKEIGYHGLSQRVNKMGFCQDSMSHSQKSQKNACDTMKCTIN
jgi:hypothetical protein